MVKFGIFSKNIYVFLICGILFTTSTNGRLKVLFYVNTRRKKKDEETDMIKGAQKQMIVVRTGNSPYFDEAYFVLRREVRSEQQRKTDILSEADRILRESGGGGTVRRRHGRLWLLFAFLFGLAMGLLLRFFF